jgi:hypothetical protein
MLAISPTWTFRKSVNGKKMPPMFDHVDFGVQCGEWFSPPHLN